MGSIGRENVGLPAIMWERLGNVSAEKIQKYVEKQRET